MVIIKYTDWLTSRYLEQDEDLTVIDFSDTEVLLTKDLYEFFDKINLHLPIKIINADKDRQYIEMIRLVISNLIYKEEQLQKNVKYYEKEDVNRC